jgi:hypothetical protein
VSIHDQIVWTTDALFLEQIRTNFDVVKIEKLPIAETLLVL